MISLTALSDILTVPVRISMLNIVSPYQLQTIAAGDADNDIPMLQAAGLGVAMGNALPHVKAEADYIAPSNEEDGVATAIREFMKITR